MNKQNLIKVQILNAFVDNNKGGNPAGVVFDADDLSIKEKQEIAAKIGYSETAFVSKSNIADYKLDFFSPNRQIAHCGHATVATFSYLRQLNLLKKNNVTKETIDGIRKIKLKGELAYMEQLAPRYVDVQKRENMILKSLGIKKTDLWKNAPVTLVNTGNSFILIPVKNKSILRKLKPDMGLITEISDEFDLIGLYPFTLLNDNNGKDASTRMFGPRYNIMEEAGTGMAAGPLACYLFDILKLNKNRFFIQQGEFMEVPSPSLIIVELEIDNGRIKSLMAGGRGVLKMEKHIALTRNTE